MTNGKEFKFERVRKFPNTKSQFQQVEARLAIESQKYGMLRTLYKTWVLKKMST